MKIIDMPDSKISRYNVDSFLGSISNQKIILLSNGDVIQNGFKIIKLELRLYHDDLSQNDNSAIHILLLQHILKLMKHSIEAIYDEGNLGIMTRLDKSAKLLTNNLGLSGLILRLIISLENILASKN